jgi:prevent-host-death family protein
VKNTNERSNRLSEVVERLEREHGRVVITKHGRPAAVVLSVADLEGLEETLEASPTRASCVAFARAMLRSSGASPRP